MPTRRRYLALVGATALAGCGFSTGDSDLESPTDRSRALVFSTSAFEDGGTVPPEFTGTGADRSPPLAVESVPERAETLALVVDDPDADGFVHWLLWNVPAGVAEISAGLPQRETLSELGGTSQGTNDFGELGYRGPLPPESDGSHSYRFSMSAVSTTLDLAAGARRDALADALEGVTVDTHGISRRLDNTHQSTGGRNETHRLSSPSTAVICGCGCGFSTELCEVLSVVLDRFNASVD